MDRPPITRGHLAFWPVLGQPSTPQHCKKCRHHLSACLFATAISRSLAKAQMFDIETLSDSRPPFGLQQVPSSPLPLSGFNLHTIWSCPRKNFFPQACAVLSSFPSSLLPPCSLYQPLSSFVLLSLASSSGPLPPCLWDCHPPPFI